MAFKYPGFGDFQDAIPTLTEAIRQRDVPPAKVVQACYVGVGFGLSMYPGEPAVGVAGQLTDEQAVAALEQISQGNKAAGLSIPWSALIAYLMGLLSQWLPKAATV